MIALVAGYFLVSYLLAPGVIYRFAFSFFLPAKRIQRTRTEEIVFSVLVVLLPLLLASILLFHTPLGHLAAHPNLVSKPVAYWRIAGSLLQDQHLKDGELSRAYVRFAVEQMRFLIPFWIFCFGEGLLIGNLVRRYGDLGEGSFARVFCDRFLLRNVSEWQILFTTFTLQSDDPRTEVELDVLSGDHLYRGRLVDWFTDSDGKLAGILLEHASRFNLHALETDRQANREQDRESYWQGVPGARLYLAASGISNYNVRFVEPSLQEIAEEELGGDYVITELPPAS